MKSTKMKTGKKKFKISLNRLELLLFVLPGLIALIIFNYLPMGGLLIAFKDYKIRAGILGSDWVGFENFVSVFKSMEFPRVLRNTVMISFLKLITSFPAPIILALLINELRCKAFKKTVQTISYLPYFMSWVVLGGIVTMMFSTEGPVNFVLKAFGMKESIIFFGEEFWFIVMLLVTNIIQGVGWSSVIYLAAICSVDDSVIEAAVVDGAGRLKQIIHVILPTILPTIITVFILNLGSVLNAGFDQIYNLYNPTVYNVADIIDTYNLRQLQQLDYAKGTAVGLFKSVVGMVFVLGANYITNKLTDKEMGIM
ncbi:MAG: sugar ABC transporter permease [Clostridia bacterium]|nr:sugar ABC transporter permease [Clostridia bacterium]